MTPEEVRIKVAEIRKLSWDDQAHAAEDDLYGEVLDAIACGAEKPAELALEARQTALIKFERSCA